MLPMFYFIPVSRTDHYDCSNENMRKRKILICVRVTAFNCEWLLEPIHVVDVYQVLTHILGITPQPHNGTWSRVEPALALRNKREGCNAAPTQGLAYPLITLLVGSFLYSLFALWH